jgi:methylase of polypeptide subunit release factors
MTAGNKITHSSPAINSLPKLEHHDLLVELLTNVKNQGYKFITVTPRTHEYFLAKTHSQGKNLRDIFGWNLPFSDDALCPMLKRIMQDCNILEPCGDLLRSKLRISSLGNDLYLHSAFPAKEQNAVFFGPDTYRFARFIRHSLERVEHVFSEHKNVHKPLRILDIGCGTGAGGIVVIRTLPRTQPYELRMNDVSHFALGLTLVNAQVAGISMRCMEGDIIETLNEKFDVIIANPPYMSDAAGRAYRDGGAQLGLDLSIRIFKAAFEHLAPGGMLILYTGVAMTSQSDPFLSTIIPLLAGANCTWSYEEIDSDVFGEELETPAYLHAHRIAAVGLVVKRY